MLQVGATGKRERERERERENRVFLVIYKFLVFFIMNEW
jgi:hypothetical protein